MAVQEEHPGLTGQLALQVATEPVAAVVWVASQVLPACLECFVLRIGVWTNGFVTAVHELRAYYQLD